MQLRLAVVTSVLLRLLFITLPSAAVHPSYNDVSADPQLSYGKVNEAIRGFDASNPAENAQTREQLQAVATKAEERNIEIANQKKLSDHFDTTLTGYKDGLTRLKKHLEDLERKETAEKAKEDDYEQTLREHSNGGGYDENARDPAVPAPFPWQIEDEAGIKSYKYESLFKLPAGARCCCMNSWKTFGNRVWQTLTLQEKEDKKIWCKLFCASDLETRSKNKETGNLEQPTCIWDKEKNWDTEHFTTFPPWKIIAEQNMSIPDILHELSLHHHENMSESSVDALVEDTKGGLDLPHGCRAEARIKECIAENDKLLSRQAQTDDQYENDNVHASEGGFFGRGSHDGKTSLGNVGMGVSWKTNADDLMREKNNGDDYWARRETWIAEHPNGLLFDSSKHG